MDSFVDRVVSGRVFKDIADVAFGRRKLRWVLESADEQQSSATEKAQRISQSRSFYSEALISNVESSNSPCQRLESVRSNSIRDVVGSGRTVSFHSAQPRGRDGWPSATSQPAALNDQKNEDIAAPAINLSASMVKQWNEILRYEHNINSDLAELDALDVAAADIASKMKITPQAARDGTDEGSQGSKATDMASAKYHELDQHGEEIDSRKQALIGRIQAGEAILREPKKKLYQLWTEILADANLLEPFEDGDQAPEAAAVSIAETTISELKRRIPQPSHRRIASQSQVVATAEDKNREVLAESLHEKELALQTAQDKVDNWQIYYNDILEEWNEMKASGELSNSRDEFDMVLLQEAQQARGDLIRAENDLFEAKQYAKTVGVSLGGPDQDSCFQDFADDGYAESMEAAMINDVDRNLIHAWMSDRGYDPGALEKADEWESKTVYESDSVSVVAVGKERSRIDRWRSVCEALKHHAGIAESL